jgi:pyruvate kinase
MPLDLVATVGPASRPLAADLVQTGATALRINGSHVSPAELPGWLTLLASTAPGAPAIVDLQGAKMRLGSFQARGVAQGAAVRLVADSRGGLAADALPVSHPELFGSLRAGDTVSIDDDRVHLRVREVRGDEVVAVALHDCTVQPRKGVNVREHPVRLTALSPSDCAQVDAAAAAGVTWFAFSFVSDGSECAWVRDRCPSARVIAKVERLEAVQSLAKLPACCDAIWICRGDLGAQLGTSALARWFSRLDPRTLAVPVLVAGQVLEHLTSHPTPTRSEVCHLADIVARGYRGIVLSDETAIGSDPVGATRQAAALLRDMQGL